MQEVILQLKKVVLDRFETKSISGSFSIFFIKNGKVMNFTKDFVLNKADDIAEEIIKDVKDLGKIEIKPGDDMLGSLFVVRLMNEDKTEEILYNFFARICEKAKALKRTTDHTEYMKLYDEIRMQSLSI